MPLMNSMAPSGGWGDMFSGLTDLYGGIRGAQTSGGINSSVQGQLGQNAQTTQSGIQSLQQQIDSNRAAAQAEYERSRGDVTGQNAGLQGNIDTMTGNLNALSDPNSPYMKQAREAIERKDAASGRRSQWGEREVQLAGTLADYVGKYAPGLQSSITGARNQINQNNQGLASIYSTMNNPADRNTLALIQMLQSQQANAAAQNTTGRQAANSATNNMTSLLGSGASLLGRMFGGNSSSAGGDYGLTNGYDWGNAGQGGDISAALGGNYYGNTDYGTTSSTGDPYSSGD